MSIEKYIKIRKMEIFGEKGLRRRFFTWKQKTKLRIDIVTKKQNFRSGNIRGKHSLSDDPEGISFF